MVQTPFPAPSRTGSVCCPRSGQWTECSRLIEGQIPCLTVGLPAVFCTPAQSVISTPHILSSFSLFMGPYSPTDILSMTQGVEYISTYPEHLSSSLLAIIVFDHRLRHAWLLMLRQFCTRWADNYPGNGFTCQQRGLYTISQMPLHDRTGPLAIRTQ